MNGKARIACCALLLCAGAAASAEDGAIVTVGRTPVKVLPDATPSDLPIAMFTGLPEEQLKALAPEGTVRLWRNVFIFPLGEKRVMIDTGMGTPGSPFPKVYPRGEKANHPDAILLTHLHADHIGGLLDGAEARFPECALFLSKPALDHWAGATGERAEQAQKILKAYEGRIVSFGDGEEILPGVFARYAPGHTPGHTLFETEDLLFVGDLLHGAAIQFEHPDICASFDMDKPVAVTQRKAWLKKVAQSGKPIAGCHLPYIGKVTEKDEGFTFTEVK